MTDLDQLIQRVGDHLAGRPVKIIWRNPPAEGALGQVCKAADGTVTVFVSPVESAETRFRLLLHELAHCRNDFSWLPISRDHTQPEGSLKRTAAERAAWSVNPHEAAANALAAKWRSFVDRNAWRYFTGPQTELECQLLSLLDWRKP